jgi:hypothetical protein
VRRRSEGRDFSVAAASVVHVSSQKKGMHLYSGNKKKWGLRGVFDLATTETDSLKRNAWIPCVDTRN